MGFINESKKALGINNLSSEISCQVILNQGAIIEGYKKICELSSERILTLCQTNNKIEILGDDLKIKEISFKELIVSGKIKTINFLEN